MATTFSAHGLNLAGELGNYRSQLDDCIAQVERMTGDLSESDINWQPEPKRWSVAQCLDHLNKTAVTHVEALPEVIRRAHEQGLTGEGSVRNGIIGGIFLKFTEPPVKLRVVAPRPFVPSSRLERTALLDEYGDLRQKMADLMLAANGLNLGRVKLKFPPVPQLRFRLGTTFAVFLAHERRHLWQAENVLRELRG